MSEVEDLQADSCSGGRKDGGNSRGKISSVVGSRTGGKPDEQPVATVGTHTLAPVFTLTLLRVGRHRTGARVGYSATRLADIAALTSMLTTVYIALPPESPGAFTHTLLC